MFVKKFVEIASSFLCSAAQTCSWYEINQSMYTKLNTHVKTNYENISDTNMNIETNF